MLHHYTIPPFLGRVTAQALTAYRTSFDYCLSQLMNADAAESTALYPDTRKCDLCDREFFTSKRDTGGLCFSCGQAYIQSQEEEEENGGFLFTSDKDSISDVPCLPDTAPCRFGPTPGEAAHAERMGQYLRSLPDGAFIFGVQHFHDNF